MGFARNSWVLKGIHERSQGLESLQENHESLQGHHED
jgi:hypothetical protein